MNTMVSVVITTYKRPLSLRRAILSVLHQTYPYVEVIVVDDNSDGDQGRKDTIEIMHEFASNPSVKYIAHKSNLNGAAARNSGIAVATGEYITFLDDDDFFIPSRLEKLLPQLHQNSRVGVMYSGVAFLYKGQLTKVLKPVLYDDPVEEILSQNSFFGTGSNFLCRTDLVRKIGGFDTRFVRNQDMEFMVRMMSEAPVSSVDEILVVKCVDSILNVPSPEKLNSVKELFLDTFSGLMKNYPDNVKNRILHANYYEVAKAYALSGRRLDGRMRSALDASGGLSLSEVFTLALLWVLSKFGIALFVKQLSRLVRSAGSNNLPELHEVRRTLSLLERDEL